MTHAEKDFECWFFITRKGGKEEDFALEYDATADKTRIWRIDGGKRREELTPAEIKSLENINPDRISITDWESAHALTFTEERDFGFSYYDYDRGHTDYQENYQNVEIDSITLEYFDGWGEYWTTGDQNPEEAIKAFFKLGYKAE